MNLQIFKTESFYKALYTFFEKLNIPVNYVAEEPVNPQEILSNTYKSHHPAFQLMKDVYFLGMVDDAAFEENQSIAIDKIKTDYDGILIFGVTLKQRENNLLPTRSYLAEITRAFNREYHYTPVTVVFKYKDDNNNVIAFANTERLKYKQEWREGEKTGKVSLLRDINIENTHSGHIRILDELRITRSGPKAVNSFDELYKYWQSVFNVSVLNKAFYTELSNWYFWAVKEVSFPNKPNRFDFKSDEKFDEALKQHNSTNVIRLLTRLLFVWFIKEKKLIPEELFDENYVADKLLIDFEPQKQHGDFSQGKNSSRYYRAILQNLFFATLNRTMSKREFRKEGEHMNVTNLMRYRNYFKDSRHFIDQVEDAIPFMNGGLFECLDKPHETIKGKQGGDKIIYIDGFSDRKDNELVVPDYIFFGIVDYVDLSADYGSKNKAYKDAAVKGLINILKSYKFTITENTPIEEDIELDPELLGKVFENLLASYNPETKTTARKQTGSFYTPREIVNYMVDESLISYLKSAVNFQFTENQSAVNFQFTENQSAMSFQFTENYFNPNDEIIIKQGNLPHWTQQDVWYFVTFRLADSIPKEKVEQLKQEREEWLRKHKKENREDYSKEELREYYRLFSERVEGWLNTGYGSCVLKDETNAKIVADALKHFDGERYQLDEWVVMPNHVHVLVKPLDEHKLCDILHSWKSFTANLINKNIGKTGQLWMHESYDHIVRNEKALQAIRNYIRQNPKKANIKVHQASNLMTSKSRDALETDQSKDALDTMIRQLLSYDNIQPFQNPETIDKLIGAIDNAKILDPAAGSGAFPMGILQKMVHLLEKLDPRNEKWKQRQIDRVNKAIENLEDIDDAKFREQSIKDLKAQIKDINEAFENNELDYGRKLYLIENCIYGVDIQPIATQISKLRFFISLIVDQTIDKTKTNFSVRPLPNLETKFVAANTLIGIDKPKEGDFVGSLFDNTEVKKLENKLKKVRHKLFSSKSPRRKRELRDEDKKLREKIADLLEEGGMENQTARQLASWDPYDQNASSPFFDPEWMFGVSNGFDVVIGNPPYISTRTKDFDKNMIPIYKGLFEMAVGQFDLYILFLEKSKLLLQTKGVLSFIVPKRLLSNENFEPLRKFLLNKLPIRTYLDAEMPFEAAVVEANVVICQKPNTGFVNVYQRTVEGFVFDKTIQYGSIKNFPFSIYPFVVSQQDIYTVELINKHANSRFGDFVNIIRGFECGFNHPSIKYQEGDDYIVRGKNIKKFKIIHPNYKVTPDFNNSKVFKSIDVFKKTPKLLTKFVSNTLEFAWDNYGYYNTNTIYNIHPIINSYDLKALMVIGNSKIANYWFFNIYVNDDNIFPHIQKNQLDSIPLPVMIKKDINILTVFAEFSLYKIDSVINKVVDGIIFELFFPTHMKERKIDILQFVEQDLKDVLEEKDFEKITDEKKENVIEQLHQKWTAPDSEVRKRIDSFAEKSPDILKPILESK